VRAPSFYTAHLLLMRNSTGLYQNPCQWNQQLTGLRHEHRGFGRRRSGVPASQPTSVRRPGDCGEPASSAGAQLRESYFPRCPLVDHNRRGLAGTRSDLWLSRLHGVLECFRMCRQPFPVYTGGIQRNSREFGHRKRCSFMRRIHAGGNRLATISRSASGVGEFSQVRSLTDMRANPQDPSQVIARQCCMDVRKRRPLARQ
jgi:hypothetical protein